MAWQAVYDDLSVFSSTETPNPDDLPLEGIQGVRVNGRPFCANIYGWEGDDVFISQDSLDGVRGRRPNAVLREGRTCSVRRFHEIEIGLGLWSPKNKKISNLPDGWMKDLIGWRLWTSKEVFDSKGLSEEKWLEHWSNLPASDVQIVILYENWRTQGGQDYRQIMSGGDCFFMCETPHGVVIHNNDDSMERNQTRYPNAVCKSGRLLPDAEWNVLLETVLAAGRF